MNKRITKKRILTVYCPYCFITEGKRCLDMRTPEGKTRYIKKFHKQRIKFAEVV